jgi:hypothetical protein
MFVRRLKSPSYKVICYEMLNRAEDLDGFFGKTYEMENETCGAIS